MQNLAGNKECDRNIRRELDRAQIPVFPLPVGEATGEVPATIFGKQGGFEFRRAWTYWVVQGQVPLAVARVLFADPVGCTDVRVNGHCGCPAPATPGGDATYRHRQTGRVVQARISGGIDQEAAWNRLVKEHRSLTSVSDQFEFADDPAAVADPFVESYHIDTEVGLRLFVDTLRSHGVLL